MAKSKEFATRLGDRDFIPNTGWLDRFKERHGIVCRSISGESAVVDTDICDDWLKNKLPNLVKNYKACDIFNAVETGLFYKLMPNKTLQLKCEKCHGGRISKERLTVPATSKMNGSEKIKLLVIRKFQNPRCFKGVIFFQIICLYYTAISDATYCCILKYFFIISADLSSHVQICLYY